jgi:hypothetical protein
MLTVHLRVNEATTGRPTPARLRITGPGGEYYAPLGRLTEFATGRGEEVGGNLLLGAERWCVIDGTCEIRLPAGVPLTVDVQKGPEYTPLRREVTLGPGQMAVRLALERWADLRSEGWFPGDTRCHFLPPHAAALEGAAEDLSVVNLLAAAVHVASINDGQTYPAVPNLLAFSGQRPALERDGCVVFVNTHNTHPALGQLGLLHTHRVVYPLSFGGVDESDDWTLADWCDQCHRKRGLAVWTNYFPSVARGTEGEALADLVLGRVDAVELSFADRKQRPRVADVYRLWSAGLTVPLVGGSGKDSNRVPLGAVRTYAQLGWGEPFSYAGWVESVRAGRTFVTNGPLLRFSVNDRPPGSAIDHDPAAGPLRLRAQATCRWPFDRLDLLADGREVATAPASGDGVTFSAALETEWQPTAPTWLAARCHGRNPSPLDRQTPTLAHTSPVSVRVAGRSPGSPAAIDPLLASLERTRAWAETTAHFAEPKSRDRLLAVLNEAREALLARRGG